MIPEIPHQFVDRQTGRVKTEPLYCDSLIRLLYSGIRENAPAVFSALTSSRASKLFATLTYDLPVKLPARRVESMARQLGVDLSEIYHPEALRSPRTLFERQIRYWECRPMPEAPDSVVSPADSRILAGELCEASLLFLKEKFFSLTDLLLKPGWVSVFQKGTFAVFRLTPDKYHYNHTPVAGRVIDCYEIEGRHHSCNPAAVVKEITPYSKNRRAVTIIDTDVANGTRVGRVAMIEIVALMIGRIQQCYSNIRYEDPEPAAVGQFLEKGRPKSLYRPGSSVDVLVFEPNRIEISRDILRNMNRLGISSRYGIGIGKPLVETDVKVRSEIGRRLQ
jgi:phosphatidylserine decarboxylase